MNQSNLRPNKNNVGSNILLDQRAMTRDLLSGQPQNSEYTLKMSYLKFAWIWSVFEVAHKDWYEGAKETWYMSNDSNVSGV